MLNFEDKVFYDSSASIEMTLEELGVLKDIQQTSIITEDDEENMSFDDEEDVAAKGKKGEKKSNMVNYGIVAGLVLIALFLVSKIFAKNEISKKDKKKKN